LGLVQIAVAIVSGVIAFASTNRPSATAAAIAFEAVFFGGFMWWFGFGRLRRDVEAAPEVLDPAIRDERTAVRLLALTTGGLVAVFAALTLLNPRYPILAGIAFGGGADSLAFHRWLLRWGAEHAVEVLRIPTWRRRRAVNYFRVNRASDARSELERLRSAAR
jgi:hypothetical protein